MSQSASAIKVGISSCLTGLRVRYDGNHKLNQGLLDALQQQFELLPICPEVEIGLGVPREPIRLVRTTSDSDVWERQLKRLL